MYFIESYCSIMLFVTFSWYFGPLSREEANEALQRVDSGTFLVRDSISIRGDFVLCVK
jgi:proto-oncogene C-crk